MSHSPGGQAGGLAIRGQPQRPRGQIEEEEEEEEDPAHNAHNNDDDVSNNPSGSTESPSEGNNNSASEEVEHNKPSKVLAESGITYNVARLGIDSLARALVGLTGRFDVVDCFTTQSGFGFCLLERPLVHVGKDSRYSCSCVSFGNRPDLACQHVFVGFLFSSLFFLLSFSRYQLAVLISSLTVAYRSASWFRFRFSTS